jgi:hypothetical protein
MSRGLFIQQGEHSGNLSPHLTDLVWLLKAPLLRFQAKGGQLLPHLGKFPLPFCLWRCAQLLERLHHKFCEAKFIIG